MYLCELCVQLAQSAKINGISDPRCEILITAFHIAANHIATTLQPQCGFRAFATSGRRTSVYHQQEAD